MRRYALARVRHAPVRDVRRASSTARAIPAGLRARPGSAAADRELCDAVSRHVRGAAHGPDLEAIERVGCSLLIHDDGGWAAVRDGSPVLIAARDDAIATDLLWSAPRRRRRRAQASTSTSSAPGTTGRSGPALRRAWR